MAQSVVRTTIIISSTRGCLLEIDGAICMGHTVVYDARLCMVPDTGP